MIIFFKENFNLEEIFSILINCFLISKIRTSQSNGDNILKRVYPYIFNETVYDYDCEEALNLINYFESSTESDIVGNIYENTMSLSNKKDIR